MIALLDAVRDLAQELIAGDAITVLSQLSGERLVANHLPHFCALDREFLECDLRQDEFVDQELSMLLD